MRRLPGIRLSLPGHEAEIGDLGARIDAIAAHHRERLQTGCWTICREPQSLVAVSRALFGERSGYTRLLALEEAGAHVEYLFQRGELGIANLEDVAARAEPGHPLRGPGRALRPGRHCPMLEAACRSWRGGPPGPLVGPTAR